MKAMLSVLLFLAISLSICFAQKIIKMGNTAFYSYEKNIYSVYDLKKIFQDKSEPMKHYEKYLKQRKTARRNGIASGVMFFGGLAIIGIVQRPKGNYQRFYAADIEIAAGLGMLLSPIPAGISIISAIAAKKNLNKALDIYNQKFEVQPGTQESINLNIGVSPGGLGFIINF